jgi:hypothetical protein
MKVFVACDRGTSEFHFGLLMKVDKMVEAVRKEFDYPLKASYRLCRKDPSGDIPMYGDFIDFVNPQDREITLVFSAVETGGEG